MIDLSNYTFWFLTGSQYLYGEQTLEQVDRHSKQMVDDFNKDPVFPVKLVWKPVLKSPQEILALFEEANADPSCAGIITWMHTFSPSKMWIRGLASNRKPILHLHTQFNVGIPWESIDMDYMNLNQSAHGDREHGYIHTRMRIPRKVVAGHWKDGEVRRRMAVWMRAACAVSDGSRGQIVRFGDNMREVAVTEGDKVSAQIVFGWSVNGWGVGELARGVQELPDSDVKALLDEYAHTYVMPKDSSSLEAIREQAKMELVIRRFLEAHQGIGFTTTFEDLHGLKQLPGLAVQRLMAAGYGFGAEGDWKTAALVRAVKVMASGLPGGTSFMEDYTYHMEKGREAVLGAHMLEICPSIAAEKPRIEVHPLSIGGKADPARLVFDGQKGPAINASLIDLGNRLRLLINPVESLAIPQKMPKLPVARVLWRPKPDFQRGLEAWILAGGAHHTVFSTAIDKEYLLDWASMVGIEAVVIDEGMGDVERFQNELRWGEIYWGMSGLTR